MRAVDAAHSPLSLRGEGSGVRGGAEQSLPSMPSACFIDAALYPDAPLTPSRSPQGRGEFWRALHGGCGHGGGVDGGLRYSGRMTPATDSPPPQPGPAAQDAFGRGVYDAAEAVRLLNFQRDATPVRRVQEFH